MDIDRVNVWRLIVTVRGLMCPCLGHCLKTDGSLYDSQCLGHGLKNDWVTAWVTVWGLIGSLPGYLQGRLTGDERGKAGLLFASPGHGKIHSSERIGYCNTVRK